MKMKFEPSRPLRFFECESGLHVGDRKVSEENGGYDEMPEACDDCWVEAMTRYGDGWAEVY